MKVHVDEDNNHYCDVCHVWLAYVCVEQNEYGMGSCAICGGELKCITHIDADQNMLCDRCGEETTCKENPYDIFHEDYDDPIHICDWCDVWMSIYCSDDDCDGYCDESECNRKFAYNHLDEDKDNYCDRCYRIINCTHENVSDHFCADCFERVTDCYSEDGDIWCDECGEEVECEHVGMEGEHVCHVCYEYLSDCVDEDGDGECDLSPYFPHSPSERS